ncbi:beta-lactamase family [Fusarium albosuccineum]|uniref:Beta-lactamase family n=1 Tax=Fusarium albosuccineum TaxID=1237068 RepID=A0A8H4L5V5_9HYPO|nr:beta-lactamase family [Fusarium albosuccineum]
MSQSSANLKGALPLIRSLCQAAGVPGLAVGIIHQGQELDQLHYGYRDVEAKLPVNGETVFYIASLTKAMTAAALGILVDKGALQWDTPIHDILPEMSRSSVLGEAKLNVLDILSHRTGKAWADALYLQSNNRILLPKDQCIPVFESLPQVSPIRTKYMYNNHAYNIAGLVIERTSGQKWDEFVTKNIFEPLGMTRTFTKHPADDQNVAAPYNILTDRSPFRLPFCNASGDTMMFAGQSVRTSVDDLLKYSLAYLQALNKIKPSAASNVEVSQSAASKRAGYLSEIFSRQATYSEPSSSKGFSSSASRDVIKEVATIVRPHVPRAVDSLLEQTYALGWNRTQLPGALDFGWNQRVLEPFPLLGEQYPGKLAIWHGGNMPGTTAALCLLPESDTAVVVLQNSLGLCDVAGWVCQLVVDILFVGEPTQDYLSLVKSCVEIGVKRMDVVEKELAKERIEGTKLRSLASYTGRYYNAIGNWFIDIKVVGENLALEFLGRSDERYALQHYHYDTFSWNLSYDETVKRAQYIRPYTYYRLEFEHQQGEDEICRLRWRHDNSVPEGELFYRKREASL